MTQHTFENVTLCYPSEFSGAMQAMFCKTLSVEMKPYAQYDSVPHLRWRGKRQRRDRGTVKTHGHVVVVAGDQTAKLEQNPNTPWRDNGNGVQVSEWKHTAFAPEWSAEWLEQLSRSGLKVKFKWHKDLRGVR